MGLANALLNNGAQPTTTTPTSQSTNLPAWYTDVLTGLLKQATAIANQPYTPFPGPQVAPENDLQVQSQKDAMALGGGPGSLVGAAANSLGSGSTLFDQSQFDKFMNPYTSGLNSTIAELGGRNLKENLLPAVNDAFTGAGQFGSTRNADFTNRAVRDTNQDILNAQSQALQSTYNNAQSSYQGALGRQVTAGQDYGNLSSIQNANEIANTNTIAGIGGQQQQNTQSNIDAAKNDFYQQYLGYPTFGVNLVNSVLQGKDPGQTVQQYTGTLGNSDTGTPSTAQNIIAQLQKIVNS